MDFIIAQFKQSKRLSALFYSNLFLSLHYALVVYINSSFLGNFFSEIQVSTLYIVGSLGNALLLLNISKILNKIGNYKTILYMISIELLATIGVVLTQSHFLIGFYFILHQIAVPAIVFNLDVFMEEVSKNDADTGSIRGIFLTLANIAFVVAPTIVAWLLIDNEYSKVYWTSFFCMIPLYYFIIKYFKNSKQAPIDHIRIKETLSEYVKNKDIYNIFICNFLLQLFYACMVIYTPLYLVRDIGFSLSEIGIMFTIMLIPFVLFELPVGELADKKYGEKEFLTVGFVIIGLATLSMSFVTTATFWLWATVLFISRIGASFVEITTDSYFFKQVDDRKSDVISFFRIARPISFVIAPILVTFSLQFIPFQYVFIILGALMIIGTKYSLSLHDTK